MFILTDIRPSCDNVAQMPLRIVRAVTHDVRFPTSVTLDGSDAMNTDPDYSAAYVVLETSPRLDGRARTGLHDRARHRGVRRRHPGAGGQRGRSQPRGDHGRHGAVLAVPGPRLAAPVARAGEGRHPPRG